MVYEILYHMQRAASTDVEWKFMKASELIAALQALVAQYGDLDTLRQENSALADVASVKYLEEFSLPPVFLIS
jgi:hypothetical protein